MPFESHNCEQEFATLWYGVAVNLLDFRGRISRVCDKTGCNHVPPPRHHPAPLHLCSHLPDPSRRLPRNPSDNCTIALNMRRYGSYMRRYGSVRAK